MTNTYLYKSFQINVYLLPLKKSMLFFYIICIHKKRDIKNVIYFFLLCIFIYLDSNKTFFQLYITSKFIQTAVVGKLYSILLKVSRRYFSLFSQNASIANRFSNKNANRFSNIFFER